jgi:hypothetical protein
MSRDNWERRFQRKEILSPEEAEGIIKNVFGHPLVKKFEMRGDFRNDDDVLMERFSDALVDAVLAGPLREVYAISGEIGELVLRKLNTRAPKVGIPLTGLGIEDDRVDGKLFCEVLGKCKSLINLRIECCGDMGFFNAMLKAIILNPLLKRIDVPFMDCLREKMSPELVNALASVLEGDRCALTHLTFDGTVIPRRSRTRFLKALGRNTSLSELSLRRRKTEGKFDGFSSEDSLSLLASLRHRGTHLKRLSFTTGDMCPELIDGLCEFLKVCNSLQSLDVSYGAKHNRCAKEDVLRYCNALRGNSFLEDLTLNLCDLDDEADVAEALDAVFSIETLNSLALILTNLTHGAAKSIYRAIARDRSTQSFREFSLHSDRDEEGAARLVIAGIALNNTLTEINIWTYLLLQESKNAKMVTQAARMNPMWSGGRGLHTGHNTKHLLSLLGNNERMILMRAGVTIITAEGKRGKNPCPVSSMGLVRAEGRGALRLVIVTRGREVSLDIVLSGSDELVRDAQTRTIITLRYCTKDRHREALLLDFSTAKLASNILSLLHKEADLDECDKERLFTLGEENADRFVRLFASSIATQRMAALVAGVMHHEGLIYALAGDIGAHLRAALVKDHILFAY